MDESGDSTSTCGCDSIADEFVVRACACPSPAATYGERAKTAIAFAFNADFARVLQAQMVSRGTLWQGDGWQGQSDGSLVRRWLAAAPTRKGGVMIEHSGCAAMLNAC